MVNLTDNAGERIFSNPGWWYKIALADGTEVGLGDRWGTGSNNRHLLKIVPAGQGLVFRYQRADGDNRGNQGWPIGDKGYLRGLHVNPDGSETILNMSLSGGVESAYSKLCMYNDNTNFGMIAEQLPKNRVLLYAYNPKGKVTGLRVLPDGTILSHESVNALALDCEFVRVSNSRFDHYF